MNLVDPEADFLIDAGQNVTDARTDLVLISTDLADLPDDDAVQAARKERRRNIRLNHQKLIKVSKQKSKNFQEDKQTTFRSYDRRTPRPLWPGRS